MLRSLLLSLLLLGVAGADDLSGPRHVTLVTESWGTVYYAPAELKDYDYTPDPEKGTRVIQSPLGKVTIAEAGIGAYAVDFPKGKLSVEGGAGRVKVDFLGKSYEFARTRNATADELLIKMPQDEIRYSMSGNTITIGGPHGQTVIRGGEGDYQVESPAGRYSYLPTEGGGFKVRGAPLVRFPYLYRGATFQAAGVGIFIDFKKLDPENLLFRFTEWEPMLAFRE